MPVFQFCIKVVSGTPAEERSNELTASANTWHPNVMSSSEVFSRKE